MDVLATLRAEAAALRASIAAQTARLEAVDLLIAAAGENGHGAGTGALVAEEGPSGGGLTKGEVARYGRQMIMPEIGRPGQERLRGGSVLLVGGGGLGCPAAIYLAAAGVGHIGVVDGDRVDTSNLHRQVLHSEALVGEFKAVSIKLAVQRLNSTVRCTPYCFRLERSNALELVRQYDVVLDCTDNPASRYLVNDAAVLCGKPLVSGSALRGEGQLTVYHCAGGPCYRCLFPRPPPASTVTNCSDGGVLGVVPGLLGVLQASEAIKVLLGLGGVLRQRLLLVDLLEGQFRSIKLRPRNPNCAACGTDPTVVALQDYEALCGCRMDDAPTPVAVSGGQRVDCAALDAAVRAGAALVVDVRPETEFGICAVPGSVNIPLRLLRRPGNALLAEALRDGAGRESRRDVVFVCRRGNDSQLAVAHCAPLLLAGGGGGADSAQPDAPRVGSVSDLRGGLVAWAEHDPSFPLY